MKKHSLRAIIFVLISITGPAIPTCIAQTQGSQRGLEGSWNGVLDAGPAKIRFIFRITAGPDGSLSGTIHVPDHGANNLKLSSVQFANNAVRLELKIASGVYEGTLNGDEINGSWTQSGQSLPLILRRGEPSLPAPRPQEPKKPYPYDEEDVAFDNKGAGVKLAGTLTLPREIRPCPAVVLISGSGPQDRNETVFGHKPFLVLADHLTRNGIAVLRYDDRGIGKSTGNFAAATTADFASDASAALEYLKGRKEINAKQIGLAGHSEGGIIAPMIAAKSADVSFIVLLAGTGLPGDELLYLQGELLARASGAREAVIARQRKIQQVTFDLLKTEKNNATVEKELREALTKMMAELTDEERKLAESLGFSPEAQIKASLSPWLRSFVRHDPRPILKKVRCPVLAINGDRDLQVPANANLEQIEAALKAGGNKNYKIVKMPGLNHLFQTCKTGLVNEYASIEETFAPAVLETVSRWILEQIRSR